LNFSAEKFWRGDWKKLVLAKRHRPLTLRLRRQGVFDGFDLFKFKTRFATLHNFVTPTRCCDCFSPLLRGQPEGSESPEGKKSDSSGTVPDLEAPTDGGNMGGEWWAENSGSGAASSSLSGGAEDKFASQLNGDWNQKVLQGQVKMTVP